MTLTSMNTDSHEYLLHCLAKWLLKRPLSYRRAFLRRWQYQGKGKTVNALKTALRQAHNENKAKRLQHVNDLRQIVDAPPQG